MLHDKGQTPSDVEFRTRIVSDNMVSRGDLTFRPQRKDRDVLLLQASNIVSKVLRRIDVQNGTSGIAIRPKQILKKNKRFFFRVNVLHISPMSHFSVRCYAATSCFPVVPHKAQQHLSETTKD